MLRRTLDTSFIVVALLSVGCTLVTDFEKTRSEVKGGAGGGVDAGGRSSSGGTESKTSDGGGSGTGSGGASSTGTSSGGATAGTTTGVTAGGVTTGTTTGVTAGMGSQSATSQGGQPTAGGPSGVSTSGGAPAGNGGATASGGASLGTAGTTLHGGSTSTDGGSTSGGTAVIANAGAAQGGAAGSGTTAEPTTCTISSKPYVANYVNTENNCQSCQPGVSPIQWSPRPDGTVCGTNKQCVRGTCQLTCSIGASTYLSGAANPDNACQSCDIALTLEAWSDTPTSRCVTAITVSDNHSCAIVGGKAYCWGSNTEGKLGNGTTTGMSTVPTPVQNLEAISDIEAGNRETCAIVGNDLYCWGSVDWDMADIPTYHPSPTPVQGLPAGTKSSFASDRNATCAVVGGDVYCWGNNSDYLLGVDLVSLPSSVTPVRIQSVSGATEIAVAASHACALVGTVAFCWGSNGYGQLGNGSGGNPSTPVKAQIFASISAIETGGAGEEHTCAISAGCVYCVGGGVYGQLGDGNGTSSVTPVRVPGLTAVTRIAAGGYGACAVSGGDAYCWGMNHQGQLGNGSTQNSLSPTKVLGLPAASVTAVSIGEVHGCAVASGNAYCWGNNARGTLGNNSTTQSLTAVKVEVP